MIHRLRRLKPEQNRAEEEQEDAEPGVLDVVLDEEQDEVEGALPAQAHEEHRPQVLLLRQLRPTHAALSEGRTNKWPMRSL